MVGMLKSFPGNSYGTFYKPDLLQSYNYSMTTSGDDFHSSINTQWFGIKLLIQGFFFFFKYRKASNSLKVYQA